jgi:excisionase family DNA binding protein
MSTTPIRKSVSSANSVDPGAYDLFELLRAHAPKLVGPDGVPEPLPSALSAFLSRICESLKAAEPLTIFEDETELSTAEAARVLSVSRQFLVQLLEQNQIPFHKTGTHRRVYARDLFAYKAKRGTEQRKTWDELVRAEVDEGVYDLVPFDALVDKD